MKKLKDDPVATQLAPGWPQTAHLTLACPSPKVNIKPSRSAVLHFSVEMKRFCLNAVMVAKALSLSSVRVLSPGAVVEFLQLKATPECMQKKTKERRQKKQK